MDRKADLPTPTAPLNPARTVAAAAAAAAADANLTSSSSSSSCTTFSTPDFLRQAHAIFKRHRPLGIVQSNVLRATRVLVSQTEPSRSSALLPSLSGNQTGKAALQAGATVTGTATNVASEQGKELVNEVVTGPLEGSSRTPSISATLTSDIGEKLSLFGMQKDAILLPDGQGRSSAAVSSFQVVAPRVNADNNLEKSNLTFENGESYSGTLATTDREFKEQDIAKMHVSRAGLKFEESNLLDNQKDVGDNRQYVSPVTDCSVMASSCVTTLPVSNVSTLQCTPGPPPGQTAFATQMSSFARENLSITNNVHAEENGSALKESDWRQHHQNDVHLAENKKDKEILDGAGSLPSQLLSSKINSSSTKDLGPSHQSKVEKAPRKKKYDPDVFFKVNGKLYQKLGKIGSGGSSEVYKVISSDCTIYALKKIKLKGRDYPTAYGFCQEIEYLNKLKGKSNIIQLVDYEVTDRTLLHEVLSGSITLKDKRIKGDECIYMVLEYGEIDLAHMLAQKWKELSSSKLRIDENWLRFYWQQMLEAVNTIHEERIVHSDLKPANFLLVRGSLKLIDFGIAKAIMNDTTNIQRDAQVGTLNYMSPEAFMCNEDDANGNTIKCGRPSDIWSLGCILYQMVYGKTPFAEYKTFWAKFKVVTDRHHKISFDPVPNPWLIDLMKRCLAWDRNERWRIPQLLHHPFLIPPIPPEIPPFCDDHRWRFLTKRVGEHWRHPEVSSMLSKLTELIEKLDDVQRDPTICLEPTRANVS